MKLDDFERVARLRGDRAYFVHIKSLADNTSTQLRVDGCDLRPSLVDKLRPEISYVAEMEIRRVDEELAKLGVEVA